MTYTIDYGMGYFHPKLGDTIVYCSAFQHFGKVIWKQKQKTPVPPVWKEVMPMYRPFDLKVKHGKATRSDMNFMHEMWKIGMKIGEADFKPVESLQIPLGRYVTIQPSTGFSGRDRAIEELLTHTEGLEVVDLDEVTKSKSVRDLLTVLKGAEFHVGPDSGCAWAAIAARTPVKVLEADRNQVGDKRFMMHQCALNLMTLNEDVEVIRHD